MTAILPERSTVLDELPSMPDTAPPVLVPGLLRALGVTSRDSANDFQQSLIEGTETYEQYCERISKREAT